MMAPSQTPSTAALETLFLPVERGDVQLDGAACSLFLRARSGAWLQRWPYARPVCEQSFKPFADALCGAGVEVTPEATLPHAGCVLALPPRQRDEARALLARAVQVATPGGRVIACQSNAEGARSGQADLAQLAGPLSSLSKHKCRVYWTGILTASAVDLPLADTWRALDLPRAVGEGGLISRPGLFAWNRVDAASALLASQLPATLHGRAADLGAGDGYLSTRLLAQCPQIRSLDLFEAEARALEPARRNVEHCNAQRDLPVELGIHWHDVTTGLPGSYDVMISNPPFHVDRHGRPALGQSFIAAAAAALTSHGQLWLVANRHLPYEATLRAHFRQVRGVIEKDGFKVFAASEAHA